MTCKCGNPMSKDFDRYRCHICGHSIWHHFRIRPGVARATQTSTGRFNKYQ